MKERYAMIIIWLSFQEPAHSEKLSYVCEP